jgi:hypothetical protein
MKLDNRQAIEIIGVTAVVLSVLFLAFELRQSNRIAIAATEIEIRNSFDSMNAAIYSDAEIAEIIEKATLGTATLEPIEERRLWAWLVQTVNVYMSVEIAFENGMIPIETYNVIFDDILWLVHDLPASRPLLRTIVNDYPALKETEVVMFLDEKLAEVGE